MAPRRQPRTPSRAEFCILLALADRQRHGYGIMQEVERRSGGAVLLGPGTLYGAIRRMLEDGLIAEGDRRPGEDDDPRRGASYRLTPAGRAAAEDLARQLADLVRAAEQKGLLRPGPAPSAP